MSSLSSAPQPAKSGFAKHDSTGSALSLSGGRRMEHDLWLQLFLSAYSLAISRNARLLVHRC